MKNKIVKLQACGDERGSLIALEQHINVPFEIKRVYYIFDTKKDVKRGFHAHKNLQQVAVAVKGSCKFILDDGRERVSYTLNTPLKGLLIDSFIWREMTDFSEDCVLMVLASELYDKNDYIRNYDEFIASI